MIDQDTLTRFCVQVGAIFDGGPCGLFFLRMLTGAWCPWPRPGDWSEYDFALDGG